MKRAALLCILCLLLTPALADPILPVERGGVSFEGKFSVSRQAVRVDFGAHTVDSWADVDAFLARLPRLQACDMYASPIGKEDAERLAAAFPQVDFGWTLVIGTAANDTHYVRTDATAFSTAHWSGIYGHDSSDLAVLRFCKSMKALDIGHNRVDDISWLREMPQLKVLILAVNYIEDISPLEEMDLEYLELFNNYITDLTPLTGMEHLLDLNLSFNCIADYSPLYGLKQLERLWLYNSENRFGYSPVSRTAYTQLREALPDTEMDNVNDPTAGGWRLHERYRVVRAIFSEGVYTPFP